MKPSAKGKYLRKDAYLNAAFEIIRVEGISRLTMRRVAQELDVSHMAIYRHFSSKEVLLTELLDEFIQRADVLPDAQLPWPEYLQHMGRKMYIALQQEPLWLNLLDSMTIGERAIQVTRAFFSRMTSSGFSRETAGDAWITLLQLVMGAVVLKRLQGPAALETGMAFLIQALQPVQTR